MQNKSQTSKPSLDSVDSIILPNNPRHFRLFPNRWKNMTNCPFFFERFRKSGNRCIHMHNESLRSPQLLDNVDPSLFHQHYMKNRMIVESYICPSKSNIFARCFWSAEVSVFCRYSALCLPILLLFQNKVTVWQGIFRFENCTFFEKCLDKVNRELGGFKHFTLST